MGDAFFNRMAAIYDEAEAVHVSLVLALLCITGI